MNVLSIQRGADTGGQGHRIQQAFARHAPGWSLRTMTDPPVGDYIAYPHDLRWSHRVIKEMWPALDVVHVHNSLYTLRWLERRHRDLEPKPTVIHYHGTQFRQAPEPHLEEQRKRNAVGIVSTLDLYLLAPDEVEWLPAPYDVKWLASLRPDEWVKRRDPSVIRVAHAPTQETIKSTRQFVAAMERLKAEGYPVEMELIQQASWAECLRRKATADIFFDQVILGFGCNSLEAWGMGIPVISGVDPDRAKAIGHEIPDTVEQEMVRRFGELPYYQATEATIYDAIRDMVEMPDLRQQYADRGRQHVTKYHDEPVVVHQLQRIYREAYDRCNAPASIADGSLSGHAA